MATVRTRMTEASRGLWRPTPPWYRSELGELCLCVGRSQFRWDRTGRLAALRLNSIWSVYVSWGEEGSGYVRLRLVWLRKILCRRHGSRRRHARRPFMSAMSCGNLGLIGVATPIVSSYVSHGMSSQGPCIVEYYRETIPKPQIFTYTRSQDTFRACNLCSCNFLSETNKLYLDAGLLSRFVSELQKTPSQGIELRIPSGVLTLLHSLSGLKDKHAKFGANRFIRYRTTHAKKHTNTSYQIYMYAYLGELGL
jgi:hypothetical protein